MLRWHADLTERAAEKSSATAQRSAMRIDARAPDPEMAPGFELLRKHKQFAKQQASKRIAGEMQRRTASGSGSGGRRPARAGSGSSGRMVQGTSSTHGAEARARAAVGAGPRVAVKAVVLADGHYIYTPRNVSGTAQAEMQHYDLQVPLRKSLAKSAREAALANEALDAADRKRGCQGMPKEVRTVDIMEEVMGFGSLKSGSDLRV